MGAELGTGLLVLIVAMSVAMAIIPVLIRYASALGMMDEPDPRKVHAVPVPRVGGVGIVLGALIALAFWLPWNEVMLSYLAGSVVLLVFGVWDDVKELGHYVKFVGQFLSVSLVVYYGGLHVTHLPLLGLEPLNDTFGQLFTIIAMVGVINAINHSDGLDGLAGGESLLSLGGIAYLAYQAGDPLVVMIAFAVMGGVFGFLRFNSHPARVFMGDGGSQFLGFSLAFLVVYLVEVSNPALSRALPALLLGLPVIDIISVFVQRAYGGMNWFKATKNHIHHRLLELGFHHYESVVAIYSVQVLMVSLAIVMPYESDELILGIYVTICILLFTSLWLAEHSGWKVHTTNGSAGFVARAAHALRADGRLMNADRQLVRIFLSVFVLFAALFVGTVPVDLSIVSLALFVLLAVRLWLGYRVWFLFLRLVLFVSMALMAYMLDISPPDLLAVNPSVGYSFYGALFLMVILAVRYSREEFFQVTPLDYLVVLIVILLAFMSEMGYTDISAIALVLQLIVLFYGVEVTIKYMVNRWNVFTVSLLGSLAIVAIRGTL